ncbi:MAG: ABC transporter permease subunit, partial [Fimbriimonas sp.]
PLEEMSLAQRQMVAIARATAANCRFLILDEPTASLSERECTALFRVIRLLRERGVSILYVSHRLEEIFALSDRVTVLRDGGYVGTLPTAEVDRDSLIQMMVGREVAITTRTANRPGEVVLEVENVGGASFSVRAGEIVALAGLIGSGRSEIARAIAGVDPRSGVVRVGGDILGQGHPGEAIRAGIGFVPEDRQHQGLHLALSIRENIGLANLPALSQAGWIDASALASLSANSVESLSIKTPDDANLASSLSGGNQQKVLLAKWLATKPKVLILDEPTRGVDVGAKAQIHALISDLAAQGMAVLMISSELPEVLALADRVLVMHQGKLVGEVSGADATQERILSLAFGKDDVGTKTEAVVAKRSLPVELGPALLLFLTLIGAAIVNPSFVAIDNLRDMLVKVAPAIIVGSALTLVILAREIDISVGSLMGFCAAILGIVCSASHMGLPIGVGAAACLGVGLVVGLINGALVAYVRIPSIIVTLAMLTVLRGLTELTLAGKWIENMPASARALGTGAFVGVPYVVAVAGLVALLAAWVTLRTPFGRRAFALGCDPAAATRFGMPVRRVQMLTFGLTGLAAGLATLFSATQLQVIESGFGNGFELVAVASVIVGGTSIRGGRGSILGTLLGATLLGIVATVLIFLRLGESATYWERAIQGGFILMAILADHLRRGQSKAQGVRT